MRVLLLILILLYGLTACKEQSTLTPQAQPLNFDHTLLLNNQAIKVVVFDTPAEREQGLMWVKALPTGQGALFVFEHQGEVAFWMKNTLIPLDLLFFNRQGELLTVFPSMQPCKPDACEIVKVANTKFVLELSGNSLRDLALQADQGLKLRLEN